MTNCIFMESVKSHVPIAMGAMSSKHPFFDNSCIEVNLTIQWKVPCPMLLPHIISLVRAYYDATFE